MDAGVHQALGPNQILQFGLEYQSVRQSFWQLAFRVVFLRVKPYCQIHALMAKLVRLLGEAPRWNVT